MLKQAAKKYFSRLVVPRDRILSAVSKDGLNWTRERGIRVDVGGIHNTQMAYYTFAHKPDDKEGLWELFYHSSDIDGTWIPRILKATSQDGLILHEMPEPAITGGMSELNHSQTKAPFLIRINSMWRMYFTARGRDGVQRILSAVSKNRDRWEIEDGFRIGPENFAPDSYLKGDQRVTGVSDTSIVKLQNGQFRMYFSTELGSVSVQTVRSALSVNGIDWEIEEGVRIGIGEKGFCNMANNPSVIEIPGGWRMYFRGSDIPPLWSNIFTALSEDGLTWRVEGIVLKFRRFSFTERHAVGFPFVVPIENGYFRMYYTGYWGNLIDFKIVSAYKKQAKELSLPNCEELVG